MSATTSTNAIFTGTSQFSSDFQQVITRATAIASLPITELNNQVTTLNSQATELNTLDTQFSGLQTAVANIASATGGSSYQATVSDPSVVGVTLTDGATQGTYSIDVVDPGSYATSLTADTWNPTGSDSYELTLDGGKTTYAINTTDDTATGVAAAINAQYSDQVQAAVVNVGTSADPDYRISLEATQLGAETPDILDNGTSLQTQQTVGDEAQYIVDGSGMQENSTSQSVTISPGVTVNLLQADDGNPVTITVTQSTSALSDALSAFATAYNSAVDEVDQSHGQTGGALAGQPIVDELSQILDSIATYTDPSSSLSGLTDLGLTLDDQGHLTYNGLTLESSYLNNPSAVPQFLGSATGGGFLEMATNAMTTVEDPNTGLLATQNNQVSSEITDLQNQITDKQDRVNEMTTEITQQMDNADSLCATLEQQYNYLSGMFSAMQTADQMYANE